MKILAVNTKYNQNNVYKTQEVQYSTSFGNSICKPISSADFLNEVSSLVKKYTESLQKESLVKNPTPLLKIEALLDSSRSATASMVITPVSALTTGAAITAKFKDVISNKTLKIKETIFFILTTFSYIFFRYNIRYYNFIIGAFHFQ